MYCYDRYETRRIMTELRKKAITYGQQPITSLMSGASSPPPSLEDASPTLPETPLSMAAEATGSPPHDALTLMPHRTFTLLAEGSNRAELISLYDDVFGPFIEPIWTAAGIDFCWLEASRKKHDTEFANKMKALDNRRDQSDDASETTTTLPTGDFEDISGWRVMQWFLQAYQGRMWHREMQAFLERQSYLASLSWPSRLFYRETYLGAQPPSHHSVLESTLSSSKLMRDQYQLLTTLRDADMVREQVLAELLPGPSDTGRVPMDIAGMFHEGILATSLDTMQQLLDKLRFIAVNYPDEFSQVFPSFLPGHSLRLGYLPLISERFGLQISAPLPESDGTKNGDFLPKQRWNFLDRLWTFFHHRKLADFYGNWALCMANERVNIWSRTLDAHFPSLVFQSMQSTTNNDATLKNTVYFNTTNY